MKFCLPAILAAVIAISLPKAAEAHFGMVIPSEPTVMESSQANISIQAKFWHPFENRGMNMVKPKSFLLYHGDEKIDLLPGLKEGSENGFTVWGANYKLAKPGLYAFVMEPEPYWEKEEDCFIIHYSKVYVDAFGDDEGWGEALGLKTEIVPLAKPTGLYAGNVFQGRVMLNGQPVPGAEVEIEWYPGPGLKGQAPYETMVTQTIKADDSGIFTYAAPVAGWWGFAALNTADYQLKESGQDKAVELGAVIWVYFNEFKGPAAIK